MPLWHKFDGIQPAYVLDISPSRTLKKTVTTAGSKCDAEHCLSSVICKLNTSYKRPYYTAG